MTTPETPLRVAVLDVNETLSDLGHLGARFEEVGLAATAVESWFAAVLRDGFALTLHGENPAFADLAKAHLGRLLERLGGDASRLPAAVEHVMAGFSELPCHPDVAPGLRALRQRGLRVVTLSNGSTSVAEALLDRAGALGDVERLMSVEDAGVWKPHSRAYRYACDELGVEAREAVLVAVHPWDTDGAQRAGLVGAWVDRTGTAFPGHFRGPDLAAESLPALAGQLGRAR